MWHEKNLWLHYVKNIIAADISSAMGGGKKKSVKAKATGAVKKSGPRGKVAPKYKNPADPTQTWTGRGKAPKWIEGKDRAAFAIA